MEQSITLAGVENLSYNLNDFLALCKQTDEDRVMLVIDNGLLIKNPRALRTQRVLVLSEKCPYKLLVSDVPFTRSAADMFAQWYALDWRILGYQSYWGFCIVSVKADSVEQERALGQENRKQRISGEEFDKICKPVQTVVFNGKVIL